MDIATESSEPTVLPPWWCRHWRPIALVVMLVGIYAAASATGVLEQLTLEGIKAAILGAGYWGWAIFLMAMTVSNMIQVPSQLFVVAAVAIYGPVEGLMLSLVGGMMAVSVSFGFARMVGGKALEEIQQPFVRRMLDKLEEHPILTVALIRLVFVMSPPINYALALSNLRFRDYFMGSLLGLPIPMLIIGLLADTIVAWLT
ncbi:MAG: VTT domain-containing protein [Myxococcota bacterium]